MFWLCQPTPFFAALSYSTGKIKIPAVSAFVISIISSAVLTASMLISAAAGAFIPESFCRTAGAVLLGVIGITGFCQNGLKSILRKHKGNGKVSFSCFNIGFVISVYLDETKADATVLKYCLPKKPWLLLWHCQWIPYPADWVRDFPVQIY